MDVQIICDKYIVLSSTASELICGKELKKFVHKMQKDNHMILWENICAEIYSTGRENLYFIYPDELKIYIAWYALPFLGDYFED